MRNRTLILILCLGGLLGCSSKPSESDIAAASNEFWRGCAKVSNVKKTNGVENGNAYKVSFTYDLEVLEDVGLLGGNCSVEFEQGQIAGGQKAVLFKIHNPILESPIKKGDVFSIVGEKNMVKSEKGWIFE